MFSCKDLSAAWEDYECTLQQPREPENQDLQVTLSWEGTWKFGTWLESNFGILVWARGSWQAGLARASGDICSHQSLTMTVTQLCTVQPALLCEGVGGLAFKAALLWRKETADADVRARNHFSSDSLTLAGPDSEAWESLSRRKAGLHLQATSLLPGIGLSGRGNLMISHWTRRAGTRSTRRLAVSA